MTATRTVTAALAAVIFMAWSVVLAASPPADARNADVVVKRLAGPSRYETACEVSRARYPNGAASAVYVANGQTLADALTVFPQDGPTLLTRATSTPQCVLDEVRRLAASAPGTFTVVVAGGSDVISQAVASELEAAARLGKG